MTGDGHRTLSTLWHHHNNRYLMIWPLWTHPLTLTPTQTLLNHPHITPTTNAPSLHNLTVFTLAAAERKPLRKSLGPLTPTPWPPPPLRNPKPPQNP
ncbi:hypothetical protein LO762_09400 [Actinocorallia sp. API 0066]|nr:hypothetical protein [Actinocorallia sp. API 0066]